MSINELSKIPTTRLRQLDLMVLLELLYRNGFEANDITFVSRLSLSQAGRLIEDVIFENSGVKLIVNMGILSANSALPDHVLDFFSSYNESTSFNVLNSLASKLLKSQINMLLTEQSNDLKNLYLNGDILFTRNDNFFYSLSSFNSLFERALTQFNLNVRSLWKLDLIDKSSYLDSNSSFSNMHLGNKLLSPKLHFDITIQSETLFSEKTCKEISQCIDSLVLSEHFESNRKYIAVSVWLIVHPIKIVFMPFNLSDSTELMSHKIKIYERYEYGY
ncbi:hypothetical protein [Francisella sp. XLW-1]|uniref:hypothetical protein n=1 Tax=Francisella sp. XLW-1 TaxID=2610887 RepID=UPI00123DA3E6|nr:hypothetical protein [Francisella sp. XLW-1]